MLINATTIINYLLFDISILKNPLIVILSVIAFIFLTCLLITLIIFKKAFGRNKKVSTETNPLYVNYRKIMRDGADYFLSLNPESVYITAKEGFKLHGYFYKNPDHRGTVIFMHGHHGDALLTFGTITKIFKDMGFSILLPDQRAHGKSEGKYLTLGVREGDDCVLWAEYIANMFPKSPIGLHGISLGGATVGIAGALKLPEEVKTIANDCGFTSPDDIISSVRRSLKLPKFPFQYFIRFWARALGKFSLKEKSVTESYKKIKLPCLFIHGVADDFIPYSMGIANYEACATENKLMIAIENAGHGLAYIMAPEYVTKGLTEFYKKHMLNE